MSEKVNNLSDKLKAALEFTNVEIPAYISENLSKDLRGYQKEALKHYLLQRQNPKTNHLMFNMATGSGKTLIMAALMLECYKRGYRNFIFFVNSTAILEKTRANFCDIKSSKYLFQKSVIIDDKEVSINVINNFNESKEDCINIHFTTIQGLFSVLTNERENALSFLDFVDEKIVFLADEAHHLNAETKSTAKGTELENKENWENWESIVRKAFSANEANLMLEFTATIPKVKEVQEKYKDKIIYEYALKAFCENGFSKRIYLLKYDDFNINARFLGGVLTSLYRELLALKHNILLKPVLLFKSEAIKISQKNEKAFIEFVENISENAVKNFYKNTIKERKKGEILSDSLAFFQNEFGENFAAKVCEYIKANFNELFILNVNEDREAQNHQILLNSLEDSENVVRVIFAVNKLDEGWDVLNLFDIVRLKNAKIESASKQGKGKAKGKSTTTSEVQLIGRGARYYPFLESDFEEELRYKRKFDKDLNNELSHLERLSYHTINEVSFINDLNTQMREQGLFVEDDFKKKYELNLSKYAKEMKAKYKFFYAKNKREKRGENLFTISTEEAQRELELIKIPLFSKNINESLVDFNENTKNELLSQNSRHIKIGEALSYEVFLKALHIKYKDKYKDKPDFNILKNLENAESKKEFFEHFLSPLSLDIHKKQVLNRQNQLEIFKYILEHFKRIVDKKRQEVKVDDFKAYELNLNEKVIFVGQDSKGEDKIKTSNYEWLYFDKVPYDSELELEFLNFIEGEKEHLNQKFSEWIVVRNEGFDEFKIYDNRLNEKGEKFDTYGLGFEPDFILFAKEKESQNFFALQCFIEAKGGHLVGKDKWKEDFLASINGKNFHQIIDEYKKDAIKMDLSANNEHFSIESLPFFVSKEQFKKCFDSFMSKL